MTTFAPIHNHSEYSALDGLSTCREIFERCQCIGCQAVGITDHGTVAGHLEFGKLAKEFGIKPIYGCELYHGSGIYEKSQRDAYHFVAGAMTDEGLRNLWRMVDAAAGNFRHVGRVNFDICNQFSEGVFATSACIQGLVPQGLLGRRDWDGLDMLNQYLEIYKDNFYIEIHTYPGEEHELLNGMLVDVAWERGIPLLYATDAHFASPEQYETHDSYVAMQWGDSIYTPVEDRKAWHPKSLYIQDEAQIRKSLSYLPEKAVDEALANSAALAEKCNAELPEIRRHLPAFVVPECPWVKDEKKQMNTAQLFVTLVEEGLVERYGPDVSDEVWDRAATEMEIYLDTDVGLDAPGGLAHYFLQAWDFCEFCNNNNIRRGPGRGSSAGTIVAYALGITDVDPLHYDLIFERFWNPGRAKGFPDIDNDFPKGHRKRVRQYLMDRWGERRVKAIGTTSRLKPKAAIDKTYKPCAMSWDEKESLKKIISNVPDIDILGPDSIGWAKESDPGKTIYVMDHVGKGIIEWVQSLPKDRIDHALKWLEILEVVCSRVSGYGVHPSGVIVADCDLDAETPCMWNNDQKIPVTCFPMTDIDDRGFVKQDLLGLKNLDIIEDWEKQVGEVDWHGMDKMEWPEEMWEILWNGLGLGIFQIEDGVGRPVAKQLKPRSVEDLGLIGALIRPGAGRSGAPASVMTRRNGGTDDKFDGRDIPILAELLEPTYGWFIYQEQVIRYFSELGYDLSDADAVRKILGKKKPEEMIALRDGMGEWEGKGYYTVAEQAGLDRETAEMIWKVIGDFAKYSFNKSHAIAYAVMGFRTLFAKWKVTPAFIMSCIRLSEDQEQTGKYVGEARRMDVTVNPPHILNSTPDIDVIDGHIYFGFSNIKGIGKGAGNTVVDLRENGWEEIDGEDELDLDFRSTIAYGGPEALWEGVLARQYYWEEERDYCKRNGLSFKKKSAKQHLQENKVAMLWQAGCWDEYIDRGLTLAQRQKLEKEFLGVIITDDCEEIFDAHASQVDECDLYSDLDSYEDVTVRLPGVVSTIRPTYTKKDQKPMGIVSIEYQGEQCEFVVFSKPWKDYRFIWKERTPGLFTLTKNDRGIRFEKAIKLT